MKTSRLVVHSRLLRALPMRIEIVGAVRGSAWHVILAPILSLIFASPNALADNNMKAFPPADDGMVRYVFHPPKQADESALKLELIVGKTAKTDAVNRHFLGGKIVEETIEGWGFPKFVVRKLGPMASTLMAVDPDEPPVERFVTLGGEPFLIRYNSALPVVVYVPEGVEVRYRIWKAEPESTPMEKG